jgi:hypothetical protein
MNQTLCRFCQQPLKLTFVDLGISPLANSFIPQTGIDQKEIFYPLHVYICESCLLVQLPALHKPEEIFDEYLYFSSFSDSWLRHAQEFSTMAIERFNLGQESKIIEIASNDGYLLKFFKEKNIPVLGIEPARNVAQAATEAGIPTIVKYFGTKTAETLRSENSCADLLIGNNVLAHVPDLNDFVRGMKIILKKQGTITMEFPHLMQLMLENQFDTIYHEHFSYFSFLTVCSVFRAHGLDIYDVQEIPTHGGSLRIYAKHSEDDSKTVTDRVIELLKKETAAGFDTISRYVSYAEQVKETKRAILSFFIQIKRNGKSIVAYGAPAKGNTLLNYCGIGRDFIDYVVDRSPHKQGHYLPGTLIPILHPDKIKETKPDFIFILPWNLKNEIIQQLSYIRSWGASFVVGIPSVQVL